MARCFCACHEYPGTYPPPCGVCGHHNDHGRYPGATNMGWVPDGEEVGPLRIDSGAKWRQRAEVAEADNERLREALTLIARGVWTAPNSVESMVWTAREALKPKAES
jgi:hypothetical protein